LTTVIKKKRKQTDAEKLAAKNAYYRVVRPEPLTSEAVYKRTRKQINATNRRRAGDMERRIAKYLRGQRTPSSGALAAYKGDVTIPFADKKKKYLIECKLSAIVGNKGEGRIQLVLEWFDKMQRDAISANAQFAILIIHYHQSSKDYVFIRKDHLNWVRKRSILTEQLSALYNADVPTYDLMHFDSGKVRVLYGLLQPVLEKFFTTINGYDVAKVRVPDGEYYILRLDQFRDFMEGV